MIQIQSLTTKSIKDPKVIIEIIKTAQSALINLDYIKCSILYKKLKDIGGLKVKLLKPTILQIMTGCMDRLELDQIKELFSQDIVHILELANMNVRDRLREKMVLTEMETEKEFKQELVKIIQHNKSVLVQIEDIKITAGEVAKKITQKIDEQAFKKLMSFDSFNFIEQQILLNLYHLYHYLLLDPESVEGFDEDFVLTDPKTGHLMQYSLGTLTDLKTNEKASLSANSTESQQAISVNFDDMIKRKQDLLKRLAKLKDRADYNALIQEFNTAMDSGDQMVVLGILYQILLLGRMEALLDDLHLEPNLTGLHKLADKLFDGELKMDMSFTMFFVTDISNIALRTGHYNLSYPYLLDDRKIIDTKLAEQSKLNSLYVLLTQDFTDYAQAEQVLSYKVDPSDVNGLEKIIKILEAQETEEIIQNWEHYKKAILSSLKLCQYHLDITKRLYDSLNHFLEKKQTTLERNGDLLNDINQVSYILEWLLVPFLSSKQMTELVEKNLMQVLRINFDIINQLELKLLPLPPVKADGLRESLKNSMLRNKQVVTKGGVVINTFEKQGTVENWLLDYTEKVGNKPVPSLKLSKYITNSQNTRDLSLDDRGNVMRVLEFYEMLKMDSSYMGGVIYSLAMLEKDSLQLMVRGSVQEVDKKLAELMRLFGKVSVLGLDKKSSAGLPSTVMSNTNQALTAENGKIIKAYNTLPVSLSKVRQRMVELKSFILINSSVLNQILSNAEQVTNKERVVAAFLLLSLSDKDFIKNKDALKDLVRDTLEQKLQWSAEDSAKIGIRMANVLGDKYKGWAYYNKASKKFEWRGGRRNKV